MSRLTQLLAYVCCGAGKVKLADEEILPSGVVPDLGGPSAKKGGDKKEKPKAEKPKAEKPKVRRTHQTWHTQHRKNEVTVSDPWPGFCMCAR